MKLAELLNRSEDRFLNPQELATLESFVNSMPMRLAVYRKLRDREVGILQAVADQAEQELPNADQTTLEKAITSLMLVLRYCGMAVLMNNDEAFLKQRILRWLEQVSNAYDLRRINEVLFRCLNQVLSREFNNAELGLLQPLVTTAQVTLIF
ncbi:MAG: hypothetical protein ACK4QL_09195 [Pseudanabaenaceae cyanobacterium]